MPQFGFAYFRDIQCKVIHYWQWSWTNIISFLTALGNFCHWVLWSESYFTGKVLIFFQGDTSDFDE